ncbi:MAG TPA: hypothetical protein VFH66_08855 [Mycobacteriales bacterium]|nr:hypothetical protein [Mycobacteriales bacterium]
MRPRLVLAGVAVGVAAATAVPALAKPSVPVPVPVGVGSDGKGGECVYAFTWVPQCVDVSEIGPIGTRAQAPRSTRLMCARLPQQQLNDAEQRACLLIFGP